MADNKVAIITASDSGMGEKTFQPNEKFPSFPSLNSDKGTSSNAFFIPCFFFIRNTSI